MEIIVLNIVDAGGEAGGLESAPYIFQSVHEAYAFAEWRYQREMEWKERGVKEGESYLYDEADVEQAVSDGGSALIAVIQRAESHTQYEVFLENC